jgi:hypothetical protein
MPDFSWIRYLVVQDIGLPITGKAGNYFPPGECLPGYNSLIWGIQIIPALPIQYAVLFRGKRNLSLYETCQALLPTAWLCYTCAACLAL